MAKERNHAFDILCGICIIRMVTLHIMAFCGKDKVDWWLEVMQWSYFFMSFFFFKAGYFNKGTGTNDKEYLQETADTLPERRSHRFSHILCLLPAPHGQIQGVGGTAANRTHLGERRFLRQWSCMVPVLLLLRLHIGSLYREDKISALDCHILPSDKLPALDMGQSLMDVYQQCVHGHFLLLPGPPMAHPYATLQQKAD